MCVCVCDVIGDVCCVHCVGRMCVVCVHGVLRVLCCVCGVIGVCVMLHVCDVCVVLCVLCVFGVCSVCVRVCAASKPCHTISHRPSTRPSFHFSWCNCSLPTISLSHCGSQLRRALHPRFSATPVREPDSRLLPPPTLLAPQPSCIFWTSAWTSLAGSIHSLESCFSLSKCISCPSRTCVLLCIFAVFKLNFVSEGGARWFYLTVRRLG